MWRAALTDADRLLAALLERTDPERDAVLVLSPVAPRTGPAAGRRPGRRAGHRRGLLRSATTRRDGYVQLADVAPTVLGLLGGELTEEIEGRAFQVEPERRPG